MKILALELNSLVEAYKTLHEMTASGHTPLEFSPNAHGVRILFKANEDVNLSIPSEVKKLEVSETVLRAYLGLGGTKLLDKLLVIESEDLWDLFEISQKLESLGGVILEIRSFKANPCMNHALITFATNNNMMNAIAGYKSTIIDSSSKALKDFLGFTHA